MHKYAPFVGSNYPYAGDIGSLNREPWATLTARAPEDLIDPNPFTLSDIRTRKDGNPAYKCWDAAIAIPACGLRGSKIIPMGKTAQLRGINTHWENVVTPAYNRVGPLGADGQVLRPNAPWIFDLMEMPEGWFLLEAAHVLAHLRGDTKSSYRAYAVDHSKTSGHIQTAIAEIIVALAYDLPLDTGIRDNGKPAEPDMPHYGIEIKSSSRFHMPYLRAPWDNREALRLDETLAVVSAGVFRQPHPYGFNTGTMQHHRRDRWSCLPSIVVIAGWETVETITHQQLVSANPDSMRSPVCYGMHPADMMPPGLFWAYLAMGHEARGMPVTNDRYRYVGEWLNSDDYMDLLMQTPPFPCDSCAMLNPWAEGAPERPSGPPPRPAEMKHRTKRIREWKHYYGQLGKIHDITLNAVEDCEAVIYTRRSVSRRIRRLRSAAHVRKLQEIKEGRWLAEALEKRKRGKRLTSWQRQAYDAYKLRRENDE